MKKRGRRRTRRSRRLFILALVVWFFFGVSTAERHLVPALLVGAFLAVLVIWIRHRAQRSRRVLVRTLGELMAMSPGRFEEAVAGLFRELGYRWVRTVGRSGDLAVDIECRDGDGRAVLIQCKRYAPRVKVGSRDVQTFIGMIFMHHGAHRGVFVTTSSFTKPAIDLARSQGIELIDGERLTTLLTVGVTHASWYGQSESSVPRHAGAITSMQDEAAGFARRAS